MRRMRRLRGRPGPRHGGGHRRRALAGAAVVAAVLAAPLGATEPWGIAAASATPTLTVTPATGLADGGTVRATGTGLTGWPALVQCGADPGGIADCDWATLTAPELGAGGTFTVDHHVFALIHTEARGAIDCRVAGRCVLVASSFLGPEPLADGARATLAFDPAAPLLPTPAITLTPATALRDGQRVRIDGREFGHRRSQTVQVYQCGPEPSFDTCRPLTELGVEPGPDGSFSVDARVWHVIRTDGQSTPGSGTSSGQMGRRSTAWRRPGRAWWWPPPGRGRRSTSHGRPGRRCRSTPTRRRCPGPSSR
jgi:Neocarzinostatin family